MDANTKLYDKMKNEYDTFIKNTLTMSPEEIIERSYEKVMKEDILSCFEDEYDEAIVTEHTAKALLDSEKPLQLLYNAWLSTEDTYMETLRNCIEHSSKEVYEAYIQNKQNSKNIESR